MKLVNERTLVQGVAERWRQQYQHGDGSWKTTMRGDTEPIYQKLKALDVRTATADDVKRIIGNTSWAGPLCCDDCEQPSLALVELGARPDWESPGKLICAGCLNGALAVLRTAKSGA